ncbi:MAG TPA: polysaccharide biosynthesis/export family protein [Alphaproteobacteria bacterium]|nr:polysaccharide biosynthesis/export family protein [Alphaproteobacteria bacterium]
MTSRTLVLATLFLAACAGGESFPTVDAPMKVEGPAEGYRLEPGNRIRLTVFGESNLSGDFSLDPSGVLALPLVGNVPASGLDAATLAQRIGDLLKKNNYLQDPRVAVEVATFRPFYVLGEVREPGEFPYTSGMTVLSAVARAGGYDYRAREGEVVLVRVVNDEQVEYRAVERTPILPGDIIKVLERRF